MPIHLCRERGALVAAVALSAVFNIVMPAVSDGQQQRRVAPPMPERNLTAPIGLRDVPIYNGTGGAVFANGYLQGTMGSESFYSRDEPAKIHKWYQDMLPAGGWKISVNTNTMIMAKNQAGSGSSCSVMTQPTTVKGYKTLIMLSRNPYN